MEKDPVMLNYHKVGCREVRLAVIKWVLPHCLVPNRDPSWHPQTVQLFGPDCSDVRICVKMLFQVTDSSAELQRAAGGRILFAAL